MNTVVEKIIESGLIDKTVIQLLEKSGAVPEGTSDLVKGNMLNASRATLREFADELYDLISKENNKAAQLRETVLDLKSLSWPVDLSLQSKSDETGLFKTRCFLKAMIDHQGKYYIRVTDADTKELVPGNHLVRYHESNKILREVITEVREMYLDDKQVCFMVTTVPETT